MLAGMNSIQHQDPEHRASSKDTLPLHSITRRSFLQAVGLTSATLALEQTARAEEKVIQGFERAASDPEAAKGWKPVSDRKIRVGIVGYGVCKFGAEFGFQNHPNVEVVAVSDLFPDRCAELAKACRCDKTYPSLEELVRDDRIEAVFVATDAPSHARHCIEVLKHGKHVASARGVWVARRCRQTVSRGAGQWPQIHDVRNLMLPRRPACHAGNLPGRRPR